jgi:polyferredoxin
MASRPERKNRKLLLLLLLLPFIVLLWPPFYNFDQPEFVGLPFFYWFQLFVIVLTAILTAALYFAGA